MYEDLIVILIMDFLFITPIIDMELVFLITSINIGRILIYLIIYFIDSYWQFIIARLLLFDQVLFIHEFYFISF